MLATVRREQLEGNGEDWSAADEDEFRRPIREQYEREGHPYFSTARLWDDGIIEPGQTRMVLGLALGLVGRAPLRPRRLRRVPNVSESTMFDTVLVANRGEIAVRIIRTLRSMGIRSVAVYSDADTDARHVTDADVARRIGPAPAALSYLSVERIIEAALVTGAQALHPGYGFLAENSALATACAEAGIVFVGPPRRRDRCDGRQDPSKGDGCGTGRQGGPGSIRGRVGR